MTILFTKVATMSYDDKYPDLSAMYAVQFEYENKLKDKIKNLETELERTRKALDVAVDALKDNLSQANFTQMLDASRFHCIRTKCESALEQITALEQKDVK